MDMAYASTDVPSRRGKRTYLLAKTGTPTMGHLSDGVTMHRLRSTAVLVAFLLAGCYHATITTGRTPSAVVVEDRWADSWIYGLVPPDTINVGQRCPNGVARVDTQLSFLNQLVGALTLGIYTPMDVRVTCA